MKRLAVLVSGNGSNLQALIDASASGVLDAEVVLVVANKAGAFGLERAKRAGIPTAALTLAAWTEAGGTRETYDAQLASLVAAARPDIVVLAGWMHILGRSFLDKIGVPVINLHPALPGMFPGAHAIERALAAYNRGEIAETGIMIHHVIPEVDAGPVLATATVAIESHDSIETLSSRIHTEEHRLLVAAVRDLIAAS